MSSQSQAVSDRLGHFDKRSMEHLLMKFANNFPPPHLLDFGVVENLQHYGRERRHEYWTIPSLRSLFANEGLEADNAEKFQKAIHADMSRTGGFAIYDAGDFHDGSDHMLGEFVDNFNRSTFRKASTKRPRAPKNPVRADGTVVTGRPRKEWSLKRTTEEAGIRDADPEVIQPTKKRARTKTAQPASNNEESSRKRGRQSKQSKEPRAPAQPEVDDGTITSTSRANEKSASWRSKAASRKIAPARTSDQLDSDPEVLPTSYQTQSKDPIPSVSGDIAPRDVGVTSLQAPIPDLSAGPMAESSVEQPQGVNEAAVSRVLSIYSLR
jgi:oxalate---CoA ligase